jgi:uncharacterized lipoprotein YmbA
MPRRRSLLGLCAAVLLPAACASPNPVLYTLAAVPGPAHPGAPRSIELRAIALARYLERSQIVQSSENYRLAVLSNEWWGEPLDAMLSRVLVQELTQRLSGSTVFAENGAITATPDATVELNIQRLDEDAAGTVVMIAQVAISGHRASTRNATFQVRPAAVGTGAMIAAMSEATGELADLIAGMLAGG